MRIINPCKKCLVLPACNRDCDAKQDYESHKYLKYKILTIVSSLFYFIYLMFHTSY